MDHATLTIALITEVFFDDPDGDRLRSRLAEVRSAGAELAVLPELPLDPWIPATKDRDPADAEKPRGRRHRLQAEAARREGVALLGGAIIRDPSNGGRHNTALLFDHEGRLSASYRKIHLPYEEDFWEAAHYEPGTEPPKVIGGFSLPLGIQICSDANRTSGCQLLAAQGAAVIFVPRATPGESWQRWSLVLRADAVTSATWVVTVNRPQPPTGGTSPIGGPSAVIAPSGEVVCETTETVALVTLEGAAVAEAQRSYPGYLEFQPAVHHEGWRRLADATNDVDRAPHD